MRIVWTEPAKRDLAFARAWIAQDRPIAAAGQIQRALGQTDRSKEYQIAGQMGSADRTDSIAADQMQQAVDRTDSMADQMTTVAGRKDLPAGLTALADRKDSAAADGSAVAAASAPIGRRTAGKPAEDW